MVRCRKVDLDVVKSTLEPAKAKYQKEFGKPAPTLTVDEKTFLPPPPSGNDELESWCVMLSSHHRLSYYVHTPVHSLGGVALLSASGKITCSNTLDDRLRIAYSQNLPAVREALFGKVAPSRQAKGAANHH